MSNIMGDAIFWIDTEKVKPNPYQPRREFEEGALRTLAESIRMYGILQPLVVTRKEVPREDGGFSVEYELISGERRLRAAKLVGVSHVPAIIRTDADDSRIKLELAIIENLQREDLNPVDRARSFERLAKEFGLKHTEIAARIGRSREYVSNSLRILLLPDEMLSALSEGKISEGHSRPLLMLSDRKEEQETLFKEIIHKRVTVREAELMARRIAVDRARRPEKIFSQEIVAMENKMSEALGTRVHVEQRKDGGKIMIDFFSEEDLHAILNMMANVQKAGATEKVGSAEPTFSSAPEEVSLDDRTPVEKKADDESDDIYSVKNFSL